jgi:hypothetical protein
MKTKNNIKNELVIFEEIDKRLKTRRDLKDNIFPLSTTHRKELRNLKDRNISGLKDRLSILKDLKSKEFYNNNKEIIEQKTLSIISQVDNLNKSFAECILKINVEIDKIKEIESLSEMDKIKIDRYYNISKYVIINDEHIVVYSVHEKAIEKGLRELFNDQFGIKFDEINVKINKLLEQYEEAINFGDLELVKEIYYTLKEMDKFIDHIAKIKV